MKNRTRTASFEATLTLTNGEVATIRLPSNYAKILDNTYNCKAGFATQKLFEMLIEEYSKLDDSQRNEYQRIINSPGIRTEEMCDLSYIMDKYILKLDI